MKDYKDVIADRYDKLAETDFNVKTTLKWMASQLKLSADLFQVLKRIDSQGHPLANARILEVGCGDGRWVRFIAEITHQPEFITGTDLSAPRVALAKKMNPAIECQVADVVETPIDEKFDIILAWDVFTHLKTKEQIQKALRNIHNALSERGVFIFFDAWAKTHFKSVANEDSHGYRPEEVVHLAGIEGFTPIFRKNVFRIFPGGRHSEQYYEVLPTWFVRFFEMICPTPPGNYFIVFGKESEAK